MLFQIMDINTGMVVFSKIFQSPIKCLKWKNDVVAVGVEDGTIALWDVVAVKVLLQMNIHKGENINNQKNKIGIYFLLIFYRSCNMFRFFTR